MRVHVEEPCNQRPQAIVPDPCAVRGVPWRMHAQPSGLSRTVRTAHSRSPMSTSGVKKLFTAPGELERGRASRVK